MANLPVIKSSIVLNPAKPRKVCIRCKTGDKAPGLQKCVECWLSEQPAHIQEEAAAERLAMVPPPLRRARVPADQWPPGRRWCAACQSFRRISECRGSQCKACASRAAWEAMLPRTYQIHGRPFTADDYRILFKAQRGRCCICGRESPSRRLATDHDHETGQVRGLLCPDPEWGCNYAILGKIRSLAMARRIPAYLETNFAESVIPR